MIPQSQISVGKEAPMNPNFAILTTMLLLQISYIMNTTFVTAELYHHKCELMTIMTFFMVICIFTLITDLKAAKIESLSAYQRSALATVVFMLGLGVQISYRIFNL